MNLVLIRGRRSKTSKIWLTSFVNGPREGGDIPMRRSLKFRTLSFIGIECTLSPSLHHLLARYTLTLLLCGLPTWIASGASRDVIVSIVWSNFPEPWSRREKKKRALPPSLTLWGLSLSLHSSTTRWHEDWECLRGGTFDSDGWVASDIWLWTIFQHQWILLLRAWFDFPEGKAQRAIHKGRPHQGGGDYRIADEQFCLAETQIKGGRCPKSRDPIQ